MNQTTTSDGTSSRYHHSVGKAAKNKQVKKNALYDTAFHLFTSKGIAHTSISDIAEGAQVAKGTFYLYFKDKYDLRDRLIRHKAAQIMEKAFAALDKTALVIPEDQIVFLAGHIVSQLTVDKITLRFIAKNLSWGVIRNRLYPTADGDEEESSDEKIVSDKIRDLFQSMARRYRNPEVLMFMIVELVGSTCYSSILEGVPVSIEELRPYLADAVRAICRAGELQNGEPAAD
ncbi:MAG: TetR/AcrR family transcriptional regulator [Lachnospiraceae bacterium]